MDGGLGSRDSAGRPGRPAAVPTRRSVRRAAKRATPSRSQLEISRISRWDCAAKSPLGQGRICGVRAGCVRSGWCATYTQAGATRIQATQDKHAAPRAHARTHTHAPAHGHSARRRYALRTHMRTRARARTQKHARTRDLHRLQHHRITARIQRVTAEGGRAGRGPGANEGAGRRKGPENAPSLRATPGRVVVA